MFAFRQDLAGISWKDNRNDIEELSLHYNTAVRACVNSHAPLKTKDINLRPQSQWFSQDLRDVKENVHKLERKTRKSGSEYDKVIYKEASNSKTYHSELRQAKVNYHKDKIAKCDSKQFFQLMNELMGSTKTQILPFHTSLVTPSNQFGEYFIGKNKKIRSDLDAIHLHDIDIPSKKSCTEFIVLSDDDVTALVKHSPSASSSLDPLPTAMLKTCLTDLIDFITWIINLSLDCGVVPCSFKHASITPLLKKYTLESNLLANYRPLSNLPFISKVLETAVATQLQLYLDCNDLQASTQ